MELLVNFVKSVRCCWIMKRMIAIYEPPYFQKSQLTLNTLRETEKSASEADSQRLAPLVNGHINIIGRYSFTLPREVAEGHLRSLTEKE